MDYLQKKVENNLDTHNLDICMVVLDTQLVQLVVHIRPFHCNRDKNGLCKWNMFLLFPFSFNYLEQQ
jgi:hypothetical protein